MAGALPAQGKRGVHVDVRLCNPSFPLTSTHTSHLASLKLSRSLQASRARWPRARPTHMVHCLLGFFHSPPCPPPARAPLALSPPALALLPPPHSASAPAPDTALSPRAALSPTRLQAPDTRPTARLLGQSRGMCGALPPRLRSHSLGRGWKGRCPTSPTSFLSGTQSPQPLSAPPPPPGGPKASRDGGNLLPLLPAQAGGRRRRRALGKMARLATGRGGGGPACMHAAACPCYTQCLRTSDALSTRHVGASAR